MNFDNQDGGGRGGFKKQMFKGNWTCSKCGKAISELPFEPDPSRANQLFCRDCHMERVRSFRR